MLFKKYAALAALIGISAVLWLKGAHVGPFSPSEADETLQLDREAAVKGAAQSKPSVAPSATSSLSPSTASAKDDSIVPTLEDHQKAAVLDEILRTRNDNDPRMDRELKVLSEGAKKLMVSRYQKLPAESRNERGTVVFLVGRNLRTEKDFEFLSNVMNEQPCRSLADCSKDYTESVMGEDLHHDSGTEVTLAYPQIVALKAIESLLARENPRADTTSRERALAVLEEAKKSPIAKVAALAQEIGARFSAN